MQHMLFGDVGGRPVARTLRAQGGAVRVADGVQFFTLDQAVEHFKIPRQTLVELWNDAYADLPWSASPVVQPPAAEGTGEAPAPPRDDRPIAILRRVVGGHLSDEQWVYYLGLCDRLGFDPWCQHLIPRVETDHRD